ncbi:hypothetical protein CKAH01_05834 [Colletotrichum kahawae]|uniref:Uncharacterized protein n=1 Tax=Colletotrichum kahawae TaxID=34407 RepID=A0AAD9YBG1_COLKA|nr:hypothetical protein CKAH01_05834 [Colletotrichum kahawae]
MLSPLVTATSAKREAIEKDLPLALAPFPPMKPRYDIVEPPPPLAFWPQSFPSPLPLPFPLTSFCLNLPQQTPPRLLTTLTFGFLASRDTLFSFARYPSLHYLISLGR